MTAAALGRAGRPGFLPACCAVILLALPLRAPADPPALPALNIDLRETSVSGISSGAFMSVQFQVAHSSIVKGAGIVAGGPYYCAQGDLARATTQCTCTRDPAHADCAAATDGVELDALERATRDFAAQGLIDDPAHLAGQRVLIYNGGQDRVVPRAVATQLGDYYRRFSVPPANVAFRFQPDAGHTMPTDAYGTACALSESPYMGKCRFDAAGAILNWIYGPLKPPGKKRGGRFTRFDQTPYVDTTRFLWSSGLDTTGWTYIPAACARGKPCRLHIAFHGCRQGQTYLPLTPPAHGGPYYGKTFVEHAGYDRWAERNNIVVLFPQAVSIPLRNPNGCWDWWGYTNRHYADRQGVQISAVRAMAERLGSGRR